MPQNHSLHKHGRNCNGVQPRGDEQVSGQYWRTRKFSGDLTLILDEQHTMSFQVHDVLGVEEADISALPGKLKALLFVLPKDEFYEEALNDKASDSNVII